MLASTVLITTREGSWSLKRSLRSFCILEGKSSPRPHPIGYKTHRRHYHRADESSTPWFRS